MAARTARFDGRVAVVTGGLNGIGRAAVERLLEEGARVLVADLEIMRPNDPLTRYGASFVTVQGDISSADFCKEIAGRTSDTFGGADLLVNNAFAFTAAGMGAVLEDWRRTFDVGPLGFARMIQNLAPQMIARGAGSIVNVSSISAHIAQKDRWTYNMAKGAVAQLTRCAALDLAPHKIRVNSVSPGWIWTREVEKASQLDGGGRQKWEPIWGSFHMLRRCGEPNEVAAAILFLLSDEASFTTGSEIAVDGGYLAMGPERSGDESSFAGSA